MSGAEMTLGQFMDDVERRLGRDVSTEELNLMVKMRAAGKDSATVAGVFAVDEVPPEPRTVRYEAVGGSTVVEITGIPVGDESDAAQAEA